MQAEVMRGFTENLALLRQALADADPLAAEVPATPIAGADLAAAFASATGEDRARLLLRALDEAIVALEVAARLADELHGGGTGETVREPDATADDPPRSAYRVFLESQPEWQTLYHYRNALAAQLRDTSPRTASTPASPPQPPKPARRVRPRTTPRP
jgi:hypothetical protein